MVSHSSHTNHEFSIWVTNVSFAIESFVTYDKVLIMMSVDKENFPTSIISESFYSLIWQIYYKLSCEKFCKKCDRILRKDKIKQKVWKLKHLSKHQWKNKTSVKLQAWHFIFKTSLYDWSRNKWLLLNSNILFLWCLICFYI